MSNEYSVLVAGMGIQVKIAGQPSL